MSYCGKCRFPLPEGADFCPNCGAPLKKKMEQPVPSTAPIGRILQAALLGALLSMMISSISPLNIDLYFIPSFLSTLAAIYLSRARKLVEAITIALAVYIFADAIMAGFAYGALWSQNIPLSEVLGDYVPSLVDVVMFTAEPITAIIAGYIGARLTSKVQVRESRPITYGNKEERGGIIYSLERTSEEQVALSSHKV